MVDADRGAAALAPGGGGVLDGDVGGVLGHGAVLPLFDPEIVDGQEALGVADAPDLAGDAVNRVLPLGHLPQAEAQDQQQDSQVAHPRAPQPHGMAGGKQRVLAILRPAGGGFGHAQALKHPFGVADALGRHVAGQPQRILRIGLGLRAADQLGQAQQVAHQQVQAQKRGDGDKPGAVEGVVQAQCHDEAGGALGIALAVPGVGLVLGDQAAGGAGQGQHQQQDDGKAHRGDEFPDFLEHGCHCVSSVGGG